MDYRDEERDFPEDTPFLHPESGDPVPPPFLQSFYVGYTARGLTDEALANLAWLTNKSW